MNTFNQGQWGRGDSNPHVFRHQILSLARLPIPALPQRMEHDPKSCSIQRLAPPVLKYQPQYQAGQLWPRSTFQLTANSQIYVEIPMTAPSSESLYIMTDNANETPLSLATLTMAPLTLPEYVVEGGT